MGIILTMNKAPIETELSPQQLLAKWLEVEALNQFNCLVKNSPGDTTLANSAGTLYWPNSHKDWIRLGIVLYGVSPMLGDRGKHHALEPAVKLVSQLVAVREHKAGEPVGYGGYWRAKADIKLGVVAIDYGDGYPRNAPEGTPAWVNGRLVRVSMDMLTVDLGLDSNDAIGDEAIMWGSDLPVEVVAEHISTITYELVTKLTPRVAVCME